MCIVQADKQMHLSSCLEKLMTDVQRNLEPKNRDKFTQVAMDCICFLALCCSVSVYVLCQSLTAMMLHTCSLFIPLVLAVFMQNLTIVRHEFRTKT